MELILNYGSYFITPLHIAVCFILIAVVLLQTGKGADIAGAFGGAGTQSAFGPRGVENYLSRLTKWAAFTFMFTSLCLSIVKWGSARDDFNELPSQKEVQGETGKATPAASPTQETSSPASGSTGDLPAMGQELGAGTGGSAEATPGVSADAPSGSANETIPTAATPVPN